MLQGPMQETGQAIANVKTVICHFEFATAKAGLKWIYGKRTTSRRRP
jgi:hypothetical protein